MIILRNKKFTELEMEQQLTPRELMLENYKMQRQIMINQRTREKLEADRAKTRMREVQAAQRIEQKKDEQENQGRIESQKMQNAQDVPRNVNLYKSRPKAVDPISMPK
jgi:hypothetical protein